MKFIIYTTEFNLPLANTIADSYIKYGPSDMDLTIVSNKVSNNYTPKEGIEYFHAGIEMRMHGYQFSDVMLKYLNTIDDDYIFFFCDDYLIINPFKEEQLNKVLEYVRNNNIDLAGFDYIEDEYFHQFKILELDYHGITIRERDKNYPWVFSLQPCIWKRESLIELLTNSGDTSIGHLDHTTEKFRAANVYKGIAFNGNSEATHLSELEDDYYVLNYLEIVRKGRFYHTSNHKMEDGHPDLSEYTVLKEHLESFIDKYDLINDNNFTKLIANYEKTA